MPRPRRKNQPKPRYVESESSEWSADEETTSSKRGGPSKDEVPAKKKQKTSEETSASTGRSTSDISMRDPSPETPATSEGERSEDEPGRSFYYKDLKTIDDVLEDFKVSYVGTLNFDEPENVSPPPAYEIPERPVYREEDIPKGWTPIDNGIDKK